MNNAKIIAVDFDGTLVENKWPEIGAPIEKNIAKVKDEQAAGAKIILWTNRVGEPLEKALSFCKEQGIHLDAVNENLPEIIKAFGTDCYHQRLVLFAALVNTFPTLAWKSHKHSDGEAPFGGGWFIVGVDTPKGPYTYHYEDKDWDLFHCKEVATAPEWDGHTDKDVERVLSLSDNESDWAAREVALASQKERESAKDKDDWDYGVACYESALRAYRSLERDGHSGMSIQITKSILNRLIDGKCLTPIEDDPDIWTKVEFGENDPIQHFQCKRMSSLFKDVAEDGTVTYSDVNRVQLINKESPDIPFRNGFGTRLIDKMYPITLPYFPADKKFKIIVEEFLTDEKNGDFDTVGYLQLILPNGEVVDLNGYFKDGPDGMVRIEQAEYEERKANRIDKK